MPTPLRAAERLALVALLGFAAVTCTDQPTEPGGGHTAQVRFTPTFRSNSLVGGLPLDNITVTVVRAPAETLVVKNAPFAVTDSVLQLNVSVTLNAPSESLLVTLDLLGGTSLLFRGQQTLLVTSGSGGTTAPAIPMTYVGPGANIAYLSIAPRDTVIRFGDTLVYSATASDASENTVGTFYLRWYTSPAGVTIRSDGRLIAPNTPSTIMVHAWTPSGVEDSTSVTFAPVPTLIAKVSGDGQSDTPGKTLALPFVVRVADAGDNPVTGAMVVWTRVTGSGTPALDTVFTDGAGHAQLVYTLGAAGVDSIRATLAGTAAFVDFTATAVAGGFSIVEVSGNGQVDTVGRTLGTPMVAEVHVQGTSTPAPAVMVKFRILYGGGSISVDSMLSDSLGRVQVTYTLDTLAGYAEVLAEPPTSGQYVTFQIQKVAAAPHHLAFLTALADTVQVGVPVTPAPVVEVRDTFNNPVLVAGMAIQAITNGDYLAPPPPAFKAGRIQFSGSVVSVDSVLTDATGKATFTGLTIIGTAGSEVMRFWAPNTSLAHLLEPFTIIPGAPVSVIPFAGDGQTAYVDSLIAVAPQALVVDTSGNGVSGVTVDFVVTGGGGSVIGGTQITDSLGYATVGSWRMGSSPGTDSLEAQVAGASPAVFTATAQPLTPTILLTLLNTNVVGVGRTATLKVGLSSPDAAGVVVTLTDLNPGVVTLDSSTATFGPVDTARFRVLSGVSAGTVDIIASAPGYLPDTITVTGSLNLITLPTTANVALGQTASLPVQLALPAPAGGVVVNVTSLDPAKVSVVTPTVSFAVGEQLKNATVSGVAIGSAQLIADNPNYAPDTSLVSTTASLNITAATLSAFSTFGAAFTTEFRSAGALTPAPTGGILVTLTPRDPTCVAAPATTTIPTGQTSKNDSLGYGGSATLPCVTYLVASAAGIDPDSVQVTINPPPALTLNFTTITIGSGMQDGAYGVNLATSTHGGRTLTLRTLTPGVALVQPNGTTAGSDSFQVFIPNGTASSSFYVGGLEGIVSDSALVIATMPGFAPDTGKVYVRQGAFDLQGVPTSVNVLASNSQIYLQMGVPNPGVTAMQVYQGARAGGTMSRLATFHLDLDNVATFKDSTAGEDTVKTVTFPIGQYYSPLSGVTGLQIDPVGVGTATVTASVPGLLNLPLATRTMTVLPAVVTLNNTVVELGAGLQDGAYGLNVSGPNHGGVTVALKVATPGVALVQPNGTTSGVDSIALPIANGTTSASFYLAGVEGIVNDSVSVIATVPGYLPATLKVRVRQPAVDLQGVPTTVNSLAANSNIYLQMGVPNLALTTMNAYQGPRFGGTMNRTAKFSVSDSAIATLRDSTANADSVKTTNFPVGQYYTPLSGLPGIQFDPRAPGLVTVVGSLPGVALQLPNATRTSTITGPVITFNNASVDIGSGLQDGAYGVNLGASAHGGVTISLVIDPLKPGIAVVQPNGTTAGTDSIQIFVPNGTSSASFFLAGLEGVVNDSVRMFATISGFGPDTLWIRVRRPAIDLQGVPATTTTLSTNTSIYVQLGVPNVAGTAMQAYQGTRAGQPTESVWVRSNAPTVARVANSTVTGDSLPVAWPAGQYYTPLSVAGGGLALDPLTTGSANFAAVHPVFQQLPLATRNVVVSTPGITLSGGTVGAGLQRSQTFNLGAPAPSGDTVIVKSSVPGILKVAPNATTPGTDSIIIVLSGGQSSASYYVQGMEDTTGTPSVDVRANGYTNGSAGFTVAKPAIDLQGVPASVSSGAANSVIYGQIGVPNGPLTSMLEYQELRAGGPGPVIATFSNSNATAAQLTTTALTAQVVTALFTTTYYTPLSVVGGGAAFDPLAVGSSTVTVSAPGFIALPLATRTVNVTP